jgi:uncharacterized membrane protein YecN with MAPEG domain
MKLVGERRAIAAIIFTLFFLLWLMNGLLGPDESRNMLLALSGCYGLAAFSLIAGYFWARWYAVGTGLFGLIVAIVGCWQMKALEPIFVFFGATHLVAAVALWGETMSGSYDGQLQWREKFHMDENAVQRLGRSVIRVGVSLPFVLMYAFAPKGNATAFVALGLAVVGFAGMVKLRTWGVLALGAAGIVMLAGSAHLICPYAPGATGFLMPATRLAVLSPFAIGLLVLTAIVPFVRPMGRWIAAR